MERIKLNYDGDTGYPIGSNMKSTKAYIAATVEAMKELHLPADKHINLFCRGGSGAICATLFAAICPWETTIIHIKKEGEWSHNGKMCGYSRHKDVLQVIIDDFISSGETIRQIYKDITKDSGNPFFPVHVVIVKQGWEKNTHEVVGFIPEFLVSK